jgi:putative transposase
LFLFKNSLKIVVYTKSTLFYYNTDIMITLKLRVKGNTRWLDKLASETNFVWNYVNDLSFRNIRDHSMFLSAFDVYKYFIGATKEGLRLHSLTLQAIADEYVTRRRQFRKNKLRWRKSNGSRRSLGWVPFKTKSVRLRKSVLYYGKFKFKVWDSYGLENYEFRAGSFNQDVRGRWYINICVDTQDAPGAQSGAIGIDLGLKDFAATSDGEIIESQRFYRDLEPKLSSAQRANKKSRVKAIHAKISNRRKDFLHKLSSRLTQENAAVFVGNVSSSKLTKTKMAKSVLDAGWSMFKTMLEYKAIRRQVLLKEINEAWTSQTCSVCKNRTGPKGLVELGIREWSCAECGSSHNRDINAAKNILALGLERLGVGIPCFMAG